MDKVVGVLVLSAMMTEGEFEQAWRALGGCQAGTPRGRGAVRRVLRAMTREGREFKVAFALGECQDAGASARSFPESLPA